MTHPSSRMGLKSYLSTMITSIIMISFAARYFPAQIESPPPKALCADAEILGPSLVQVGVDVGMKRLGLKSLDEGPQTEGSECNSAEGIMRIAFFFRRYWFSTRVSSRTMRPEALVDWRRRVSWTRADNRGQALMMSGIWTSCIVPQRGSEEMWM